MRNEKQIKGSSVKPRPGGPYRSTRTGPEVTRTSIVT